MILENDMIKKAPDEMEARAGAILNFTNLKPKQNYEEKSKSMERSGATDLCNVIVLQG